MRLQNRHSQKTEQQKQEQQDSCFTQSIVFFQQKKNKFQVHDAFKVLIKKQGNNDQYMILQEDSIYTGQIKDQQAHGLGKIYISQQDAFENTTWFVYEGDFKEGQINGRGILYHGKSNRIKIEGLFLNQTILEKIQEFDENGEIIQKQQKQNQLEQDDRGGKMFRIKSAKQQQQQVQTQVKIKNNDQWLKYDVLLSKDDQAILLSEKQININIVKAKINQLNRQDSQTYFHLNQNQLQNYKRSIVILVNEPLEIPEYDFLQGQFWTIYQKVLFVVNQKNDWVLIKAQFTDQVKLEIYDPISKKKPIFYYALCKQIWAPIDAINKQFNSNHIWSQKNVFVINCPQCENPQDAGIYVCKFAEYLIADVPMMNKDEEIIQSRKNELFQLIKKEI